MTGLVRYFDLFIRIDPKILTKICYKLHELESETTKHLVVRYRLTFI